MTFFTIVVITCCDWNNVTSAKVHIPLTPFLSCTNHKVQQFKKKEKKNIVHLELLLSHKYIKRFFFFEKQ